MTILKHTRGEQALSGFVVLCLVCFWGALIKALVG